MAEGKKSVLLYCDIIHTVEKLDDETAGKLFKHYLQYINDLNPKSDNMMVEIAFEPIKQNLKRDLVKWEKRAENSRENGKNGGRPPKEQNLEEPKKPNGLFKNPEEPKKPVKVTVKDKVTVKYNTDVDIIYYMYPAKCPYRNRSTGRCERNKTTIRKIIKEKGAVWLEKSIENYLEDCKKTKTYLKNFGTFLNNIPDIEAKEENNNTYVPKKILSYEDLK